MYCFGTDIIYLLDIQFLINVIAPKHLNNLTFQSFDYDEGYYRNATCNHFDSILLIKEQPYLYCNLKSTSCHSNDEWLFLFLFFFALCCFVLLFLFLFFAYFLYKLKTFHTSGFFVDNI